MNPEAQKQTTDWLIAIGTIALPIVTVMLSVLTVFQDMIRAWILRPKLSVSIGTHTKGPFKVEESITEKKDRNLVTAYSFDLLIHNNGNQRAVEVEIFASALFFKQADDTYKEIKSFPRRNLLWRGTGEVFAKAISPGMQRQCQLIAIINPVERSKAYYWDNPALDVPADKTILGFQVFPKPFARTHLVGIGTYHLVLYIAAANTKPKKVTVEISHTGQWFDEEDKMTTIGIGLKIV
jgi:hypothetical protein